ncbi:MAG TPA: phosphotransferase family protein, partial [Tepidiformaceae bacterium]|nr:phosphotransferase family protein [Tepidiformaceae bacterium]
VPLEFDIISGGRSNLTYSATGGGQRWVLRRPPLGHVLPTAHDMAREFKVLAGVTKAGFPAPAPIALCEDTSVNEYPFYVMDYREGVIVVDRLPDGYATRPEDRRAMSIALIDTMAKLHAIDYNAVGLGDFGRPEGYCERQVRRWSEQWERSETRPLPEIQEVIRRLRNSIPAHSDSTIVHGDYRLGNMMLAFDDPGNVVAVLDWEMSTLGDPLTDLGYTLLYWTEPGDPPEAQAGSLVTQQEGFLSRAELIEEYSERSGRSVEFVDWYLVMAAYKLAVIVEGIWARHLKGQTVGEGFEGYGERVVHLVKRALAVADASSDPRLRGVA